LVKTEDMSDLNFIDLKRVRSEAIQEINEEFDNNKNFESTFSMK
jgi:hypothetical protein